jgi:hypothetical protein
VKLDIYVWKARRCPVLLAVLPVALAVLAAFPSADWKLMLPLFTFCGLFMLVGQVGRDRGSNLQDRLFASWGGKPTTVMLRHRESPFDETTLAKLHDWLAGVTGVQKPSKRKESASPEDADQVYEAFVRHLRDATRDKAQYPLVFEENVSYGFRRNTWGLRPYGIAAAVVGTLGAATNLFRFNSGPPLGMAIAATTANGLLLLFWLFWVQPRWVRIPARAYAERLMEAGLRMARADSKSATAEVGSVPPVK